MSMKGVGVVWVRLELDRGPGRLQALAQTGLSALHRGVWAAQWGEELVEVRGAGKQCDGAELAEFCGTSAVIVFAWSDDGGERDAGFASGQSVVNVVAEIERFAGIAFAEDFVEAFGVGLHF